MKYDARSGKYIARDGSAHDWCLLASLRGFKYALAMVAYDGQPEAFGLKWDAERGAMVRKEGAT